MENNWLQNLKVGDEVIVYSPGYYPSLAEVMKVTRLTKTQVEVGIYEGRWKFSRRNCGEIGGTRRALKELNDESRGELEERDRRREACKKIRSISVGCLDYHSVEKLEEYAACLERLFGKEKK